MTLVSGVIGFSLGGAFFYALVVLSSSVRAYEASWKREDVFLLYQTTVSLYLNYSWSLSYGGS